MEGAAYTERGNSAAGGYLRHRKPVPIKLNNPVPSLSGSYPGAHYRRFPVLTKPAVSSPPTEEKPDDSTGSVARRFS